MAVAPHHLASQAALAILRDGGNAIEAMVAAASTIAVVYPHMNSIGGDGFWLIVKPDGETVAIDACGAAGSAVSIEAYRSRGMETIPFRGPLAANTVAGTVSGWDMALKISQTLGGKLPLSALLADAIHYARNGFPVTDGQAETTLSKLAELKDVPGFAEVFVPQGAVPKAGDQFVNLPLASTLQSLADDGLDSFYRGALAQRIVADLAAAGSLLTIADLQAHRAELKKPLQLAHSAGTLFNTAPPTQGLVSLAILGLLDRVGLSDVEPDSADHVHLAVEATKRAFGLRDQFINDPAYMTVDPQALLAPAALDALASGIDIAQAASWGKGKGPGDTIWMGTCDASGLSVSFIQSIYHEFGSGIVLKETGINWQNRGASFQLDSQHLWALVPGKKPFHTLNPAAARLKDGRVMVYGNMGGDGQPQSQSAVFTRHVVFGQALQTAITAPRWLLGRTWGKSSDSLKLESRFPVAVIEALRARGHEVDVMAAYDSALGHAGAIVRHPDGLMEGASDPRSDGVVAAF
ncbi:gamma-glutamyltransferase family protein [Herbaspirillum sp. RTI4]|nr:gamma-glutamyltransferase family protein [Herbaspirillum sp. RTI4]MDY7579424.1 gamma-glutamyltransferase family protein [Herbaspirillum sp. RTI4]MEA9980338.1 gamma-glutamyltransferase family protein [Herbaspirillum sp. RTI4]